MALHTSVAGARALCKPPPAAPGKAMRRRRGSLVRCRAYVWSKDDLARLDALALRPREASIHDPLLNDDDRDAAHQDFSVLFCKHFRAGSDDAHKRGLRRPARSEGKLLSHHKPRDTHVEPVPVAMEPETIAKDPDIQKLQQSPAQHQPHTITGIAATLIDLTL